MPWVQTANARGWQDRFEDTVGDILKTDSRDLWNNHS